LPARHTEKPRNAGGFSFFIRLALQAAHGGENRAGGKSPFVPNKAGG